MNLRWSIFLLCTIALCKIAARDQDWANVGGDKGHQRYSNLDQINRNNVAALQVAWSFHTSDASVATTIECTPIVIGGVMYLTTALSKEVALDAENGHERWKYDPYPGLKIKQPRASGGVNRGLAHWSDRRQARIFLGACDGRLTSLDANTGLPDAALGKLATVDLRDGIDVDLNGLYHAPTY